jgi:hypothetical protein
MSTWIDENGLTIVGTVPANAAAEVRAYVQPYRGRMLAHLRVFVLDQQGVGRPTKKGIAIDPRDLPELARAVEALLVTSKSTSA